MPTTEQAPRTETDAFRRSRRPPPAPADRRSRDDLRRERRRRLDAVTAAFARVRVPRGGRG